ncbi:alpha/beta hydrolase [Blastochloris viridis]|uniref:Bacillibactin trilactone hydrolase siderophore n=1 Tax=Blastochloris viridis TaxID=1079 RepID=A0A0H5BPD6_BLAVI|nr:alpha/beta hydrolase-fold protein [Blastochloris viridis]ALK10894.1 Ferri-bacillibactin esterase BesA [Blastochloris viridis]BAR99128.1 bacillibactin trilactone hydrolase siderophore [Blastochloris viridis]CUU43556.1 Ferri-bacillibactin esterase BesA [Blastochloris viridis]
MTQRVPFAACRRVDLPGTWLRPMRSRQGRDYRVFVAVPAVPPPAAGYPAIVMLDANAAFATLAEAVRLRSLRPGVSGVAPAVVIGIGYPTDEPFDMAGRTLDYTPPGKVARMPPRPDGTAWPPTGGADTFLDFVADEVLPAIGRELPLDPARRALFGHSFGGLCTLYALFTRPALFRTYAAASPSIWFNDGAVLAYAQGFAAAATPLDIDLLITIGGCEQEPTTVEIAGADLAGRTAWKRGNRMVGNARELAARLTPLAARGLRTHFVEFPDEDHVSVLPAAISRAVTLALGRPLRDERGPR